MVKPRVFISHSARGDAEALALIDELKKALDDDFSLRIDFEHLKLGVNWRNTLNTWIGGCDAAIILLSKKALASKFVAYETNVLTFRPKLTVIPILIGGVDYPDIEGKDSPLSPSGISRTQGIRSTGDTAWLVAEVKKRLKEVTRGKTPVDRQARRLEELLRPVGESLIVDDYLPMLDYDSDPWEPDANPRLLLALQMMSAGIQGSREVLRNIRHTLRREGTLGEVFELIATSWVDFRSAKFIKEVATGDPSGRFLATDAEGHLIAEIYVRRASELPAEDSWNVAESNGLLKGRPLEELKEAVEVALRAKLNVKAGESVEQELALLDRQSEPVFVSLPANGIGAEELTGLRAAFPTLTFFFRAGSDPLSRAALSKGNVVFIVPPLDEGFEKTFCNLYTEQRKYVIGET